ncbi:MAG: 2Fe-2S iron-sulfur cluster-binding protein [Hyphomicrobiaceae bacterium]
MHDFVPLTVVATRHETKDALSVTFAAPDQLKEPFRFRPGQHMALRARLGGEEVRRTYSICSGPDDPSLSIAIKRIPGGRFSNWAFDHLRPGATIEAMPPAGRFILPETPGEKGHVLAIAAGIGITPIVAMAEHAMRRQPDARFTLIYGNRDRDSVIFGERLEDLKDTFLDRFNLIHVLSRNEESDTPLFEGRITPDKIGAFAGHLFDIADVDQTFICGPGSMIRDVRNALFDLGMPRERVHHEFFAPAGASPPRQPSGAEASTGADETSGTIAPSSAPVDTTQSSEVVAIIDGSRHRFTVAPGEVVVDAALRAGVKAPYSCKGGMCSTCRARLVEGHARMRVNYSLEPWEVEKGFILTCQAIPESSNLVVDYDAM